MARRKSINVFPIKSTKDADEALAEVAEVQRTLVKIEADMNQQIDQIKADARLKAEFLETKLAGLENGLQAFAEYNKSELFTKQKSLSLMHGSFGFRKSTSLKPAPKNTWAMVLGLLKEKGFPSAVRVKESCNKEVLAEWDDDRLAIVNVRRVSTDQFWYEVDESDLKPF